MNRNLSGLYSGFIATGPMTVFMLGAHEQLPQAERSPLPPATLSLQLLKRTTGIRTLSPEGQTLLTLTSHFGYGAAAGVLYANTLGRTGRASGVAKGALYGMLFWAGNYFGLSPALKMRASGPKMPPRRNTMMFFAHLVWGAALGYSEEKLRGAGKEILAGAGKAVAAE